MPAPIIEIGAGLIVQPPYYWRLGVEDPESSREKWGAAHKEFRKSILNLEIEQYAELIGRHEIHKKVPGFTTVYKWENGERVPEMAFRYAINETVRSYIDNMPAKALSSIDVLNHNLVVAIGLLGQLLEKINAG